MLPYDLPVHRQLQGGRHYYRITADDRFEELQRIGGRWVLHEVQVKAYPEMVRLREMLEATPPFAPLDALEWSIAYEAAVRI